MVGQDSLLEDNRPLHTGHFFKYVDLRLHPYSTQPRTNGSIVDGPVASYFTGLADITAVIVLRFITIIVMSPLYFIPSLVISLVVAWVGQIYIKAQLAVKREMSNARSPILGHFGAAVTGIGNSERNNQV